jgi:hypothetical protein
MEFVVFLKANKTNAPLEKYEATISVVVQPTVPAVSLYAAANLDVRSETATPVRSCLDNTQNTNVG